MRICFFYVIIFIANNTIYSQNQYSISKTLNPIKIEYSDFVSIIEEMNHLIQKYDSLYYNADQSIMLENKDLKQIVNKFSSGVIMSFNKAFELDYQYSNYRGQITSVNFSFDDNSRRIKISGTNLIEIETLVSFLDRKFNKHRILLGGLTFRGAVALVLLLISMYLIISRIEVVGQKDDRSYTIPRSNFIFALSIWGFLILCIISIFKFELIFPGFLIYTGEAGIISQYANHFTFWSFILALTGISVFALLKKRKKNPS